MQPSYLLAILARMDCEARAIAEVPLAFDAAGNLYVADQFGDTIRKIAPDGTVTTIAGMALVAGSVDGPASSATFNAPSAVAVDSSGVLYVADTGNALIRKIDLSGNVSTLAGTRGAQGFTPGPLPGVIDPPTRLALFGKDLYFTMDNAVGVVRNAR
jgi:DNA-binding beta-propeller fold protein YncE